METHNAIVNTLFANCVANVRNDDVAGPVSTRPAVLNRDPWHGQMYAELSNPVMVHASCVHVAISAVNVSCAVRATRNRPAGLRTCAAPPTVASGDAESICTTTALPLTLPLTFESSGMSLGLDPPPPPHACASEPRARHEAAWQACRQNARRDGASVEL
jgi:hypothetical protein